MAVALAMAVLGLAAGTPAAGAAGAAADHTALESSHPAADSAVPAPLGEVRLRFTTRVNVALTSVAVTGPAGVSLPAGSPEAVPGTGESEVRVPLVPALGPGRYSLEWRTVGPDGHPIRGTFAFQVEGDPEPAPPPEAAGPPLQEPDGAVPAQAAADDDGHAAGATVRWLFYLSLVGMVGATAFRLVALGPLEGSGAAPDLAEGIVRRTRRLGLWAGVLGVLVLPVRLWHQVAALFGVGAGLRDVTILLGGTAWGAGWLLHAGALAVFFWGVRLAGSEGRSVAGWRLMALAAVAAAFVPALSGHPWGAEARGLAVTAAFVHVLAAGVWMGALGALVLAGLPAFRKGNDSGAPSDPASPPLFLMVNGFSRMALVAVVVLVLSGATNTWIHLGPPSRDWLGDYGRALIVKLAILAGALALGFYNWRVVRPTLRAGARPGTLRIPASVELAIGVVVLAAAAWLVGNPPP